MSRLKMNLLLTLMKEHLKMPQAIRKPMPMRRLMMVLLTTSMTRPMTLVQQMTALVMIPVGQTTLNKM